MDPDPKRIIDEAMQLHPSIRAFIAEVLLDTLDVEENFLVSSSWQEEIQKRCAAIDTGTARLVDNESAFRNLRNSLA
jgi:hypothetical protein